MLLISLLDGGLDGGGQFYFGFLTSDFPNFFDTDELLLQARIGRIDVAHAQPFFNGVIITAGRFVDLGALHEFGDLLQLGL